MKIKLDENDMNFLKINNFDLDYGKDYSDDEYLKLLDDLYFQETSYVGIDKSKANRFADIADKVAKML